MFHLLNIFLTIFKIFSVGSNDWRSELLADSNKSAVILKCECVLVEIPYFYTITKADGSKTRANTAVHFRITEIWRDESNGLF